MTLRIELQNDIANIRLGQLLVCALIRFPVQVQYYYLEVHGLYKKFKGLYINKQFTI